MTGDTDVIPEVGVDEAARLAASGHRLLDVREDDEWEAGHAPGAVHIALGELPDRLGELDASSSWLAVCRRGSRSASATAGLRRAGLDVRNVTGGMTAWHDAGHPVVDSRGEPGTVI